MTAYRMAACLMMALAGVIIAWHYLWLPPGKVPAVVATVLHLLPLFPGLIQLLRRHRSAPFWGALGALITFSHGVMEAFASPHLHGPAWAEIVLSLGLVITASWRGAKARFSRRRAVS